MFPQKVNLKHYKYCLSYLTNEKSEAQTHQEVCLMSESAKAVITTGWLNNRNLCPSSGGCKSKGKVLADSAPGGALLMAAFLLCPHMALLSACVWRPLAYLFIYFGRTGV
jgi:hypothetical protein